MNKHEACHETLYAILNDVSQLVEMLGRRFLWQDRKNDETLSWTSSLLFALVHATSRLAKGQRHVRIHVIDTTKVTTLRGDPVEFFFAPDLLRLLNIQAWHGWRASDQSRLKKSWFTHEWITQNVVKSPAKHSFEADIEELIRTGLYDFASELQTRHKKDMNSLYDRCVFTRGAYHGTSVDTTPVTDAIFDQAKELARCFRTTEMVPQNITCVRLHLIIDFLALEARPERDEGLMTRIRSDYSASDLSDIDYSRNTRVANNLPEQIQALALSRDACVALGLPETAETRVWVADQDFDFFGHWLRPWTKEIKPRVYKKSAGLLKKMMEVSGKADAKLVERDEARVKVARSSTDVEVSEASESDSDDEQDAGELPGKYGISMRQYSQEANSDNEQAEGGWVGGNDTRQDSQETEDSGPRLESIPTVSRHIGAWGEDVAERETVYEQDLAFA